MIVISDASAIIALSTIGHLEILKELFHEIVILSGSSRKFHFKINTSEESFTFGT